MQSSQQLKPGDWIGPYQLRFARAIAPTGRLWDLAYQRDSETVSGIGRVVSREPPMSRGTWSRLTARARAAMDIEHPAVLKALDVAFDESRLLTVYELVKSDRLLTLSDFQATIKTNLAVRLVVRLGLEMLDAIQALHDAALRLGSPRVFGGMLPSNILLASDGTLRLIDVYVAPALAEQKELRGQPEWVEYLAPEQVNEELVDARTDIYVVGCVLWELFVGRRLHFGEPEAVERRIRLGQLPGLPVRDDLPSALREVIQRALTPDPRHRYDSAQAMAQALLSTGVAPAAQAELSTVLMNVASEHGRNPSGANQHTAVARVDTLIDSAPPSDAMDRAPRETPGTVRRGSYGENNTPMSDSTTSSTDLGLMGPGARPMTNHDDDQLPQADDASDHNVDLHSQEPDIATTASGDASEASVEGELTIHEAPLQTDPVESPESDSNASHPDQTEVPDQEEGASSETDAAIGSPAEPLRADESSPTDAPVPDAPIPAHVRDSTPPNMTPWTSYTPAPHRGLGQGTLLGMPTPRKVNTSDRPSSRDSSPPGDSRPSEPVVPQRMVSVGPKPVGADSSPPTLSQSPSAPHTSLPPASEATIPTAARVPADLAGAPSPIPGSVENSQPLDNGRPPVVLSASDAASLHSATVDGGQVPSTALRPADKRKWQWAAWFFAGSSFALAAAIVMMLMSSAETGGPAQPTTGLVTQGEAQRVEAEQAETASAASTGAAGEGATDLLSPQSATSGPAKTSSTALAGTSKVGEADPSPQKRSPPRGTPARNPPARPAKAAQKSKQGDPTKFVPDEL